MQFRGDLDIGRGTVSTTDNNGAPTCITSWETSLLSGVTYSGRITTKQAEIAGFKVADYWVLPDLSSYLPGEGALEQCKYFTQGPPPIALTAANEIVLPQRTLPYESIPTTQAAFGSTSVPTTAQPAGSSNRATPSRTSGVETASTLTNLPSSTSKSRRLSTETTIRQEEEPALSAISTEGAFTPSSEIDIGDEQGQEPATLRSAGSEDPPTQSGTPDEDAEDVVSSRTGTLQSNDIATQGPNSAAKGPVTLSSSTNDGDTKTATLIPEASADDEFVRQTSIIVQSYSLRGPTITGGGEVAAISGVSYSALSSGLGVIAISNAGSTTLQASQLASYGISTVPNSPNAYILPAQMLATGGSAVVISAATYYAVPQGSGIGVAVNDQTSRIALPEPTNVPEIGQIDTTSTDVYVLEGSITVRAGGAAATISNNIYSALPFGFGILVSSGGGTDDFAAYIAQGIGAGQDEGSYIIGINDLSAPARLEATVSGVFYSVLPSSSGILVVSDGESTTIEFALSSKGSFAGEGSITATNGSGGVAHQSVVVYTGAASPKIRHPALIQCLMLFGITFMFVCL